MSSVFLLPTRSLKPLVFPNLTDERGFVFPQRIQSFPFLSVLLELSANENFLSQSFAFLILTTKTKEIHRWKFLISLKSGRFGDIGLIIHMNIFFFLFNMFHLFNISLRYYLETQWMAKEADLNSLKLHLADDSCL